MLFPDLSEYQTTADLAGIKKMTPAIIMRVAYGASHPDEVFVNYRAEAHAQGFEFIGLYQYLVKGQDPVDQAKAFCALVGKLQPGEIPILDLEEGDGDQSSRASAWFGYVDSFFGLDKQLLSQRSWLYSSPSFVVSAGLTMLFASVRRSWVADYQTTEPAQPPHTLWQSTNGETGANITSWPGCGNIDTNYYSGTIDQLAAMAYQVPAPVQTPQEEEMISQQVASGDNAFITFPAGSFSKAIVYADFVSAANPVTIRLAFYSMSNGYTIHTIVLDGSVPAQKMFDTPADTNAVSVQNVSGGQFGITVA